MVLMMTSQQQPLCEHPYATPQIPHALCSPLQSVGHEALLAVDIAYE